MRILALGGIAGPVLFSLLTAISAARRADYSHTRSFISELGATGTPNASIMNYLGFVAAGLLIAAFGISLLKLTSRRLAALAGSALIILFGVGMAVSGILTCDPGCPDSGGSTENKLHGAIGPAIFLAFIAGVGSLGLAFRQVPWFQRFSVYSLVTSVIALGFLVALVTSLEARTHTGLWQRLVLATLFLWSCVIALRAFRSPETLSR